MLLEDVYILLCDQRLSSIAALVPLLEGVTTSGKPLLVMAEDFDSDALAMLVVNSVRGVIKTCAVKTPGFGERRHALLQDIAVLTGASVVGSELGLTLDKVSLKDLGRARRVEVDKEHTTLIGGGGSATAIQARLALIRKEREASSSHERKQFDE